MNNKSWNIVRVSEQKIDDAFPVYLSGGIGDFFLSLDFVEELNKIANFKIYTDHIDLFKSFMPHIKKVESSKNILNESIKNFIVTGNTCSFKTISNGILLPDDIKNLYKTLISCDPSIMNCLRKDHHGLNELANIMVKKNINLKLMPFYLFKIPYKKYNCIKTYPSPIKEVFITIHNGFDTKLSQTPKQSMKVYPLENFIKLVKLIKNEYPNIKIVQLGSKTSIPIEGVDVNLIEKTNLETSFAYLNNSILHIDGDSGLVHARKFISNKKSIVLFGPTNIDFFKYEDNINIVSKSFSCANCWLKKDDWNFNCVEGYESNFCMKFIKPEDIFEQIKLNINID